MWDIYRILFFTARLEKKTRFGKKIVSEKIVSKKEKSTTSVHQLQYTSYFEQNLMYDVLYTLLIFVDQEQQILRGAHSTQRNV